VLAHERLGAATLRRHAHGAVGVRAQPQEERADAERRKHDGERVVEPAREVECEQHRERNPDEHDLGQRPNGLGVAGRDELAPRPPEDGEDGKRAERFLPVEALREVRDRRRGDESDGELPGAPLASG
jgi:hypothetical protein